jgi:hypothetical protein
MATITEQRAGFEQVAGLLREAAATSAHALAAHRGTPAGEALDRQLEHALDRLALLYGRGTYENLATEEIVATAIGNELRLAAALEDPGASAAATERAWSLLDAARRGYRLHVREPAGTVRFQRGAYVEPLRPEVERWLWSSHEPYLRWREGAMLILDDDEARQLRAAGDEVRVLFLGADELLDLDGRGDQQALDAELERRLAAARSAPDGVGDSRDRFALRMLLDQSTVLRNLRDRLADGHPSAHAELLPVIAGHRAVLQEHLVAAPPPAARAVSGGVPGAVPGDLLGAAIEAERDLQALVTRWAAAPDDPSGLRDRFRAVAGVGTRLAELERHHA